MTVRDIFLKIRFPVLVITGLWLFVWWMLWDQERVDNANAQMIDRLDTQCVYIGNRISDTWHARNIMTWDCEGIRVERHVKR